MAYAQIEPSENIAESHIEDDFSVAYARRLINQNLGDTSDE
jgi:hypothetical protein